MADHYPHLLLSLYIIRLQSDAVRWHRAHLFREAVTQNSPGSDLRAQRVERHPGNKRVPIGRPNVWRRSTSAFTEAETKRREVLGEHVVATRLL
jgi:hypothetical protein